MILKYNKALVRFEYKCEKADGFIPRSLGLKYAPKEDIWHTTSAYRVLPLANECGDEYTSRVLQRAKREYDLRYALSDAKYPLDGLGGVFSDTLKPFQVAALQYLANVKYTLVADDMGLGKTRVTLEHLAASLDYHDKLNIIVAPASLKINWLVEYDKWFADKPNGLKPHIFKGNKNRNRYTFEEANVIICSYGELPKLMAQPRLGTFTKKTVLEGTKKKKILTFSPSPNLKLGKFVLDEAHYVKTPEAERSRCARLLSELADSRLFLTGTPMTNAPIDLFNLLNLLVPHHFNDRMTFAKRYCEAQQGQYGWVMNGADHLEELSMFLRKTVMLRRDKVNVLDQLPDKSRQLLVLPSNGSDSFIKAEREGIKAQQQTLSQIQQHIDELKANGMTVDNDQYKAALKRMGQAKFAAFEALAKLRYLTAISKIPMAIEYIEQVLAANEPVVVFAHHRDVLNALKEHFGNRASLIMGGISGEDRQKAVEDFQNGVTDIFLGSIMAAGTGLTLTRARYVVFIELDWTSANISQAEDRCWRMGQKNNVVVVHIVYDESIDQKLAQAIIRKQEIAEQIMDSAVGDNKIDISDLF